MKWTHAYNPRTRIQPYKRYKDYLVWCQMKRTNNYKNEKEW